MELYADPTEFYADPKELYADPKEFYTDPTELYADLKELYADPTGLYADLKELYADLNFTSFDWNFAVTKDLSHSSTCFQEYIERYFILYVWKLYYF